MNTDFAGHEIDLLSFAEDGALLQIDDAAARAGGRVDDSVDFERRAFELELRTRTEAVGLEAPRDFERVEIRRVDLRKPRVVLMLQVSRVRAPFDVRGIAGGPLRAGS